MDIKTKGIVLCAGAGNRQLLEQFNITSIKTQLRPLKMVYVKQAGLPELFLHCIGNDFSLTPELTVTTHRDKNGATVWYLGGELAEAGVNRSDSEQITAAKSLLQRFLPWIDVSAGEFQCLDIARAEPDIGNGYRPDDAYFAGQDNVIAAWPTKLTLAPSLADKVIEHLQSKSITADAGEAVVPQNFPRVQSGTQPWNRQ